MPLSALILDVDDVLLDTRPLRERAAAAVAAEAAEAAAGHANRPGDPALDANDADREARVAQAVLHEARDAELSLTRGGRALADAAQARGLRVAVLCCGERALFDALDRAAGGALSALGTVHVDEPAADAPDEEGPLHRAAAALGLFGAECGVASASP